LSQVALGAIFADFRHLFSPFLLVLLVVAVVVAQRCSAFRGLSDAVRARLLLLFVGINRALCLLVRLLFDTFRR
jgi:hypothetical protein